MMIKDGVYLFGFWPNMPYGIVTDEYADFAELKNSIDKQTVIKHIESLDDWISSTQSCDIFTGESINSGFYTDGNFQFPVDFLRYYRATNIGIPYEYESYLKNLFSQKPLEGSPLKEETLYKIATDEVIRIFGKPYLRENFQNTCKAQGMASKDTYMLFVGLKGSKDLPQRLANDHGWVVYAKILVNAFTGEIIETEYVLE